VKHRTYLAVIVATLCAARVAGAGDLEFRQLNWLDDQGGMMIECSRVGEFYFDPWASHPIDEQFLEANGGGWINVAIEVPGVSDPEWVVQNLYLCYPDPDYMDGSHTSVHFGLPIPDGYPVTGVFFDLRITPDPLGQLDPSTDMYLPVVPRNHHTGGIESGGSGMSMIPFNPGPWIGPDYLTIHPIRTERTWHCVALMGPVDESLNGCAPGACTRSIQYLADTNGFDTDNPGGMYNDLYDRMQTNPQTGTAPNNMANGKKQYTTEKGLPVNTRTYEGCGALGEIMDALADGADVEIIILWDPVPNGGGHTAQITSITQHGDGSYTINYVDDPTQGDGRAESAEHSIHIDADGEFWDGQAVGFMVEEHGKQSDINGDGVVDQADLGQMLAAFNTYDGFYGYDIDADTDGNGVVDQGDLGALLGEWDGD
jgi:hypothetical protein